VIKWVHDAALSAGSGRFDFKTDMEIIKPDIYICNDDASGMEKRVEICKEMGIELVVPERKAATGLEARSSTSMKARLRDMVRRDDAENQSKAVADFNTVIPWRFCFAGGWMDLKWCNELYPGCAITINIKFNPAICRDFCGLATSSRKCWIKLWNGNVPNHLEAAVAAKYLYGAENFGHFGKYVGEMPEWENNSYSAGSQDHCGLMFPGMNKLCYTGAHWPSSMVSLNDRSDPAQAAAIKYLEDHLYIVDIPFVSRPGNYNSQRVNKLTDDSIPREEKVAYVKALSDASELAWQGIQSMNSDMIGEGLSNTMKAWEACLPYTVDPYKGDDPAKSKELRDFWTQYDRPHTKGCLFSGAGGGFLMVISDTPIEGGVKIEINTDPICKPYPSDKIGDEPHPVPDQAPMPQAGSVGVNETVCAGY
jgi:hypothetical protein